VSRRSRSLAAAAAAALAAIAVIVVVALGGGHRTATTTSTTQSPTSTTGSATSTTGAGVGEQFGVSVNRLFNDRTFSVSQIDAQLTALAATGATLARTDALWELTEPAAPLDGVHRYDWSFDDQVAADLASHHLRWLAILDYAPAWAAASPQLHAPPRSAADYASFAAAFARRYGRGGVFWDEHPALPAQPVQTYEIWNEPDNPVFWTPEPDAGRYAALYLAARSAIKAIDPGAAVIVGGLTRPASFLASMLSADPGLTGNVDGVAIHPYGPDPAAVLRHVHADRTVLDSLGLGSVPLYVTEVGWTTMPPGALSWAPASIRGRYLSSTVAALGHSGCGVAAVVVYTWVTPERDPRDREDWFGIHSPSGEPSPDTISFAQGVRAAQAPSVAPDACGS
jgi:hypothetical protein